MNRLWLYVAAALICCVVVGQTYAEVQNIRLSGEIRVRGFYVNNMDLTEDSRDLPTTEVTDEVTEEVVVTTPDAKDEDAFLLQRTRITVEADLEEQVLVVASIDANGAWGSTEQGDFPQTEDFDTSLSEGYIQLQEMWYSPATLKLGRQYLNYGRGLILSSKETELRYDAARMVWDQYPFTFDFVFAKLYEGLQSKNDDFVVGDDDNLWFLNLRYEFEEAAMQDAEVYFGYRDGEKDGASPGIVGLRGDIMPSEEWTAWGEAGYEFGDAVNGDDLKAWVVDLGTEYIFAKTSLEPKLKLAWTYASGDTDEGKTFVPWGDYNYWGFVFSPTLSNIHILNAAVEVLPVENLSLGLELYYYLQDKAVATVVGSPYKDNGGVGALTNGFDENLGAELDFVVGYDYSNDVRTQFYVGAFMPGDAYGGTTGDDEAVEVRGEIEVSF